MDNKNQVKTNIFGWILFLPAAFGIQAIASLLIQIFLNIIGFKSQLFLDSVSAFIGTLLFIFFASYFAPSKKIKVSEVIFWILCSLSILSIVLGLLGLYSFVDMKTPNIIIPILQIIGALYAVVFVPFINTQGSAYDILLGKIAGLGGGVTFIGGLILLVGLIIALFTKSWETLNAGAVVTGIGIITWIFPYISSLIFLLRDKKLLKQIK